MRFADFSPSSSPSLDQQRDALSKGLGRALQWATTGRLDDDALLAACLRDQRHDSQVEEPRGRWLWQMIRAVDAANRFRVPILHALHELPDDRSANQLCELALCYAEAGDEAFRTRLYEIVEQKPIADSHWLGEDEIVRLDGEKGFLFAAGVRGKGLAGRGWEWDDESLVWNAVERFGEGRVNDLLGNTADEALRSYREGWYQHKRTEDGQDPRQSHQERMRAITIGEILSAADSNDTGFHFRGWGRYATETNLLTILEHLWAVREPTVITKLLQVFSNRAYPRFDARLVGLCKHIDAKVRRQAIIALEQVEHPLIRQFALSELKQGGHNGSVVGLFSRNFQQGDEQRILESIEFPADECELHWLLMDVIEVLKTNPNADCSRLGVIAYASTPCENCRYYSARLLHNQHVAPEWLLEECRFDSSERPRNFVAEITNPPQADSE